jgi:glycosyltransferase involved in cell wall biosynthesis
VKLLLVIYGSLSQISGGYLYDREVVSFLRAREVGVDVWGLRRLPYPFCRLQALAPRLKRLLRRPGKYDVIVVDELTFPSLCDPGRRRHPGAPRLVVLVHHLAVSENHPPLPRRAAARLERRLLAAADAVLVNSATTAATVRELLRTEKPQFVCPPGSDAFKMPERGEAGEGAAGNGKAALRLLITGNIIPRKGHHLLPELLAPLKDLPWELRVVGGAPERRYRRRLKRLIRRAGLSERVIFTGELAPAALAQEYAQADIFVFPSAYEGFGISLAEAVRCGLPCVAFDSGALSEWAGRAELLVPAGDLRAFQDRLAALIRDPTLRERAAGASRNLAGKLPAWEQTGSCCLAALKAVLGRPAGATKEQRR